MVWLRRLAFALLVPLLAGSLQATKTNILGTRTKVVNGMVHFGKILRSTIPVTATPLPQPLRYSGGNNCTFELFWSRTGAADLNGEMVINTAPVRDRLAISVKAGDALTSLLVTPAGNLMNFNSIDPFTHGRITLSNLSSVAEKSRERMRQIDPNVVNPDIMVGLPMLPRLVENDGSVGAKVAVLNTTQGEWASYYYQGMVQYKQWGGALLDLVRVMNIKGKPTPVRLGFLVVEYRTMMPLIFVFENADQMRAKVVRCDK